MIYIFSNKPQQVWQNDYLQTYLEFLPQIAPVELVKADTKGYTYIKNKATEEDLIWITHYADIGAYRWDVVSGRTIFRISGTSAHPWCYQVDPTLEYRDFLAIDFMLSPHPNVTKLIEEKFYKDNPDKLAKIITTGYPMVNPKIRYQNMLMFNDKDVYELAWSERKDRIVIGGRLSPDKQPMLAMWLLQDIVKQVEVVFCYAHDKELDWFEYYGGRSRWEMLGFKFQKLDHNEFLAFLAESKYYFSCSLGDTMCYSAFEAISLGCYAMLPDTMKHGTGLPHISCMTNAYTYRAFDKVSVEQIFEEAHGRDAYQKQNTIWTDPNRFICRLRDGIYGTNSYKVYYGEE